MLRPVDGTDEEIANVRRNAEKWIKDARRMTRRYMLFLLILVAFSAWTGDWILMVFGLMPPLLASRVYAHAQSLSRLERFQTSYRLTKKGLEKEIVYDGGRVREKSLIRWKETSAVGDEPDAIAMRLETLYWERIPNAAFESQEQRATILTRIQQLIAR